MATLALLFVGQADAQTTVTGCADAVGKVYVSGVDGLPTERKSTTVLAHLAAGNADSIGCTILVDPTIAIIDSVAYGHPDVSAWDFTYEILEGGARANMLVEAGAVDSVAAPWNLPAFVIWVTFVDNGTTDFEMANLTGDVSGLIHCSTTTSVFGCEDLLQEGNALVLETATGAPAANVTGDIKVNIEPGGTDVTQISGSIRLPGSTSTISSATTLGPYLGSAWDWNYQIHGDTLMTFSLFSLVPNDSVFVPGQYSIARVTFALGSTDAAARMTSGHDAATWATCYRGKWLDCDLSDCTLPSNSAAYWTDPATNSDSLYASINTKVRFKSTSDAIPLSELAFDINHADFAVIDSVTAGPLTTGWTLFWITHPTDPILRINLLNTANPMEPGSDGVVANVYWHPITSGVATLNIDALNAPSVNWYNCSNAICVPPPECDPPPAITRLNGCTKTAPSVTMSDIDVATGSSGTVSMNISNSLAASLDTLGLTIWAPTQYAVIDTLEPGALFANWSWVATVAADGSYATFTAGQAAGDSVAMGASGEIVTVDFTTSKAGCADWELNDPVADIYPHFATCTDSSSLRLTYSLAGADTIIVDVWASGMATPFDQLNYYLSTAHASVVDTLNSYEPGDCTILKPDDPFFGGDQINWSVSTTEGGEFDDTGLWPQQYANKCSDYPSAIHRYRMNYSTFPPTGQLGNPIVRPARITRWRFPVIGTGTAKFWLDAGPGAAITQCQTCTAGNYCSYSGVGYGFFSFNKGCGDTLSVTISP